MVWTKVQTVGDSRQRDSLERLSLYTGRMPARRKQYTNERMIAGAVMTCSGQMAPPRSSSTTDLNTRYSNERKSTKNGRKTVRMSACVSRMGVEKEKRNLRVSAPTHTHFSGGATWCLSHFRNDE